MKRILSQVFVFISGLLFLGASSPKQLALEALLEKFDYEVSFYSLTMPDEDDLEIANAGSFYITTVPKEKESETNLDSVVGKSYELKSANFDLDEFISGNGFEIKITQNLENTKVLYLFSDKLNGEKIVNNKRINLQIAITDNAIIAASPVILGSY